MKYDVVIVGSGLGGLQCGYLLSKKGMNVCVLERCNLLGGCLQSFKRKGNIYDTGFHYIGGLDEGQPLNQLFHYYDLMGLDWVKMDPIFDEVNLNGHSYYYAQTHERFVETLAKDFPHQRENLQKYSAFLQQVGDHIFDSLLPRSAEDFYGQSLFARSAKEYLYETITDPVLRDVLAGCSLKMELSDTLPLYTFAQINNSFIDSAWRLRGGGSGVANCLADSIRKMGGTVRSHAEVTQLIEENGKIARVEINGEEQIEADWVISNAHPAYTLSLIKESSMIRKIYRNRINRLANTFGMFTANIWLKPGKIFAKNHNIYIYKNADLWNYQKGKTDRLLVNFYAPMQDSGFSLRVDLLSPMLWEEVQQWSELPIGHRGESYVNFKEQKTQECIQLANKVIPGFSEAIDGYCTSTPISYHSYTNTAEGSAYGIRKDFNNPMLTVLTPRTPVPNLLLTGQNLNLHGILGVSMTSCFTCAEIVGMDTVRQELKLEK